jgi:RNA recognition motif-containing protein
MDIYVGNIPYESTEDDISALFGEHGPVKTVRFIRDYETKRFKGFGFVTMDNPSDATTAIESLNGKEINGRELKISSAQR